MITDDYLLTQDADIYGGGVHRIYRFPNGWGLSAVNGPMLHTYSYAWEIAVLNPGGHLDYSTPLTDDVMIFLSDELANKFIKSAASYFEHEHEQTEGTR